MDSIKIYLKIFLTELTKPIVQQNLYSNTIYQKH